MPSFSKPGLTPSRVKSGSCRAIGIFAARETLIEPPRYAQTSQRIQAPTNDRQIRRKTANTRINPGRLTMTKLSMSRRDVLRSAAAIATITALGIDPKLVLGAEDGILKLRMIGDIQVLDPGYMIG